MPATHGSTLTIEVVPFSVTTLRDTIKKYCALGDAGLPEQAQYLCAFLSNDELETKALIIEHPYTDRHYSEEYRSYYSTIFRPPPPKTTRIHFFQKEYNQALFESLITRAATDAIGYKEITDELNNAYLGFMVLRPLPSAPIGRTILRPFGKVAERWYIQPAHRAHLAGIELRVRGVPFQQQEVAVGVCATTAIWVALAAAARSAGHRSPTPNQITEAATRHILTNRAMPADGGLDLTQVLESIRANGYEPYLMKPENVFDLFTAALKCYLLSNIPVVLLLNTRPYYHAVTLVGYRAAGESSGKVIHIKTTDFTLKSVAVSKFYVHEDRLGPYARMKWLSPSEQEESGSPSADLPAIQHEPYYGDHYQYPNNPMGVYAAIVPLNPKLRLSAAELISIAGELRAMMRMLLGEEAEFELYIETKFSMSGDYIKEILKIGMKSPTRAQKVAFRLNFPRYVGVIRFFFKGQAVCDIVCDTSDIQRPQPRYAAILSVISFNDDYVAELSRLMGGVIPEAVVM